MTSPHPTYPSSLLTPQVLYEVGQFHLAFWLYAVVVQVSVEHDDSKGKQEHRVCALKGLHLLRVVVDVTLRKRLHQPFDFLRLTLELKSKSEISERDWRERDQVASDKRRDKIKQKTCLRA